MAATGKTFKVEPETVERLQAISNELGMTWDETFNELAGHYMQSQAAKEQGREAEVGQFRSLLNQLSDAYTQSLQLYANVEETTRQKFEARIASAEQSVASLKEAADAAKAEAKDAQDWINAVKKERDDLSDELSRLKDALEAATASADADAEKHESALEEMRQLNTLLKEKNETLTQKVEASEAELAAAVELETTAKEAKEEAKKEAARADAAEAEVPRLTAELAAAQEKAKADFQELKGRYEEKLDAQKDRLENEKETAVLDERRHVEAVFRASLEAAEEKHQERIEKMQAAIDKLTEQRDAWQEKFYALRDMQKTSEPTETPEA